jgi:hypothetical protein
MRWATECATPPAMGAVEDAVKKAETQDDESWWGPQQAWAAETIDHYASSQWEVFQDLLQHANTAITKATYLVEIVVSRSPKGRNYSQPTPPNYCVAQGHNNAHLRYIPLATAPFHRRSTRWNEQPPQQSCIRCLLQIAVPTVTCGSSVL